MSLIIEKDLIQEILMSQEFDWDFVLDNNPIPENPKGEILLVSRLHPPDTFHSKITILRDENIFYIVGHIHLRNYKGKKFISFLKLVEHQKFCKEKSISAITDLYDPYYNVTWSFEAPEEVWSSIMNNLRSIRIPLLPHGLVGNYQRHLFVKNSLNDITYKWFGNNSDTEPVNELMNSILNYSLQKIDTAYIKRYD